MRRGLTDTFRIRAVGEIIASFYKKIS